MRQERFNQFVDWYYSINMFLYFAFVQIVMWAVLLAVYFITGNPLAALLAVVIVAFVWSTVNLTLPNFEKR